MVNLSPPDTQCKNCAFNFHWEEEQSHLCILDKFIHYTKLGISSTIEDNQPVLKNFLCPYFRPKKWYLENKLGESKTPLDDAKKILIKENELPYTAIILYPEENKLPAILRKLNRFNVKPKSFIVVVKDEQFAIKYAKDIMGAGIPFSVSVELEDNAWHSVISKCDKTEFVMLIDGYPYVDNNWAPELTTKIQDNLLKFSYAENKEKTITLIHPYVYNSYYLDYQHDWLTKLKEQRDGQKYIL